MDEYIKEERPEIKPREANKKRKISYKRLGGLLLVLAAAGLIISEATGATQFFSDMLNPPMHFVETTYITHETHAAAQIYGADGGFFLLTRDAMRFHNDDGAEVFRHGHVMSNPVMFGRDNYVAILEQGGRLFHVYNRQGLMYSIPTNAPIVRFAMGVQGFAAVMMNDGGNIHEIELYNNFGTRLHYGRHADQNILPMLMDISYDGRVLAISYVDINDAEINSFISFVSIDGSHAGADYIFAENRQNVGQIIGSIRFLADGSLVAASDARIFIINSAATTIWETELNNRITHIEFAEAWFAVAYGDAILNRTGHAPNTIIARNAFGLQLFAYTAQGRVESMQMQGDSLVVGLESGHFIALSSTGQVLWELALPSNTHVVEMLGNSNSVAALSPTQTSILHRVREN